MLVELYECLKRSYPRHGLEIVFVSSDRDAASFRSYFASMPWLALPMSSDSFGGYKQRLSDAHAIRGIPSLVVLDAMSGQVVVSAGDSRREVIDACNRGDDGVDGLFSRWMDRLPPETKELASMLEKSVVDVKVELPPPSSMLPNGAELETAYLRRPTAVESKEDVAVRVKSTFTKLVEELGMPPNAAAAKAIRIATGQASSVAVELSGTELVSDDEGRRSPTSEMLRIVERLAKDGVDPARTAEAALATALKYAENARNEPWNPKFRLFKLSNKVADRMMPMLELFTACLGVEVGATDSDFCGSFPVCLNLDELVRQLHQLIEATKAIQEQKESGATSFS
jgi:hypothetical protein